MTQLTVSGTTSEALAKRILKMAWEASAVFGMGALQDRGPEITEEQLWERGCDNHGAFESRADRGMLVSADYLFGRMMKLSFHIKGETLTCNREPWRADYHSFCRKYPTFADLAAAAAKSLGATVIVDEPVAAK